MHNAQTRHQVQFNFNSIQIYFRSQSIQKQHIIITTEGWPPKSRARWMLPHVVSLGILLCIYIGLGYFIVDSSNEIVAIREYLSYEGRLLSLKSYLKTHHLNPGKTWDRVVPTCPCRGFVFNRFVFLLLLYPFGVHYFKRK